MKRHAVLRIAFGLATMGSAVDVHAQFGDFLNKIVPPSLRGASAPAADKGKEAHRTKASAADVAGAPPVGPLKGIKIDLPPDRQCNRPQEQFNVLDKVIEYGGAAAAARLERLVQTDFRYSDLDPKDKEMLKYLAQQTIWVPVEVESALGTAYELVASTTGESLTESQEITKDKVEQRLNSLRGAVQDFPGTINLVVNPQLTDGAFAKFGGVILISGAFLETMAANPSGGDLVLAHELSHIYKRHAIKSMQFTMLQSDKGWSLSKKVLERAMRGMQTNVIRDGLFMMTTTPQIIDFVKTVKLDYESKQELEADACSVVWLRSIKVDPSPAWDQFEAAFAVQDSKPTTYAASHPPTSERRANYKAKVTGKPTVAAVKSAAVKEAERALQKDGRIKP